MDRHIMTCGYEKRATSNAAIDTASVSEPTTSAASDTLPDDSTDSRMALSSSTVSSTRSVSPMGATSKSNGSMNGSRMYYPHLAACIVVMIVSLANLWWRDVPLAIACAMAGTFLFGVGLRWWLDDRK